MEEFLAQLRRDAQEIQQALEQSLPLEQTPYQVVVQAMRYSLLGGGKRLRGALALEFCREFSGQTAPALPFACALEMVHAYSLIHDDLPCMDDDQLRRGKPSCHVAYGESTALLAGDALLTKAFQLLLSCPPRLGVQTVLDAANCLAAAAGVDGMIGGQVMDLANEGVQVSPETLAHTDALKTGALIQAACQMGCLAGGASPQQREAAQQYGREIGIAFQITDDILDQTSSSEVLGKPVGSDGENHKSTYLSLYGIEGAGQMAQGHICAAKQSLEQGSVKSPFLYRLADYILAREN